MQMNWHVRLNIELVFVTLEGDIVNPGGSMTGGGARKSKVFCLKRRVDNNETPIRRLLASNRII